jgi:hypothetical protein
MEGYAVRCDVQVTMERQVMLQTKGARWSRGPDPDPYLGARGVERLQTGGPLHPEGKR